MKFKNNGIEISLTYKEKRLLCELVGGLSREIICATMELSTEHDQIAKELFDMLDNI